MPSQTLSSAILTNYSFRHERFWVWISIPIIMTWSAICVVLLIFALQFLPGELGSSLQAKFTQRLACHVGLLQAWLRVFSKS